MEHKIKQVVRTRSCKIDHCSCGAVHISVGATTVRIKPEAARELRDALVKAMAELDTKPATTVEAGRPSFRIVLPESPKSGDGDGDDDDGPQFH